MTSMRDDARRVLEARRERASSTPAPFAAPVLSTAVLVALVALLLGLLGLDMIAIGGVLATIALAGAVAAHRTTASLAAGATLLLVRPYQPGERVRLYAPEHCALIEAEIVRIGPVNTTLATSSGLLVVANTRMLRAAPQCRG